MWNDNEVIPIIVKKIIIYLFSALLTILLFYISYKYIIPKASDPNDPDNVGNYIASIAVILTIVGYILNMTNNLISRQIETDMILAIEVVTENNFAIITSTIENKSYKRISNMNFFLFIDQPLLDKKSGLYMVNHVLKHDCINKYNCKFSKICKEKKLTSYPHEFRLKNNRNIFYGYKKLDFLSPESVLYINPGERFSEDVVFNLKPGVYRVLLIGMHGKKLNHCSCANKQFIIQ